MRIDTFRKRAMGKVDAAAFLAEHRNFLCGFKSILPVLALLENRVIFPTPALMQILTLLALEKDPFEEKPSQKTVEKVDLETGEVTNVIVLAERKERKKGEPKRYQMFLFEKEGSSVNCKDTYEEDSYTDCMKVANRKLFQNEASVYMDVIGDGISTRIHRVDAMREMLGHGPGGKTATKKTAKTSASLGQRCSAKNFVAKFSRG
jgi:hypothetical protein